MHRISFLRTCLASIILWSLPVSSLAYPSTRYLTPYREEVKAINILGHQIIVLHTVGNGKDQVCLALVHQGLLRSNERCWYEGWGDRWVNGRLIRTHQVRVPSRYQSPPPVAPNWRPIPQNRRQEIQIDVFDMFRGSGRIRIR